MTPKDSELEQHVQGAIRSLHERYLQLDKIADVMVEKQARQLDFTGELRDVSQVKEDIRSIETQTAPLRKAYRDSREHSSETVSELTKVASQLLLNVMAKIENLEQQTQLAFQKLAPQVDENVRVNQMKQAYGNGQ